MDSLSQFEQRKRDHIAVALSPGSEPSLGNGLDRVDLVHEALPELDFSEIEIYTDFLGHQLSPLFVSSMTAGHGEGEALNITLAKACEKQKWMMGVGSQRRQLFDKEAVKEWTQLRKAAPDVVLCGNIGLSQLIQHSPEAIEQLIESIGAVALFVHTNPLQEVLQPEGTPQFRGGLHALRTICEKSSVPVILKETGCGFSRSTLEKLIGIGLMAVDVSGFGGTHWGRVEGGRNQDDNKLHKASQTFQNWGISTLESLLNASELNVDFDVWSSGGIRTGLDAARSLALGARRVGVAKPLMAAALEGEEATLKVMEQMDFELKMALFCTGYHDIKSFTQARPFILRRPQ